MPAVSADRSPILTFLAVVAAFALCACAEDSVSQAPKRPLLKVEKTGDITAVNVTDIDLEQQTALFKTVRSLPSSENARVIQWLKQNQKDLQPGFLYELSRRLFESDKREAMVWFTVARVRARYDGFRCADKTAAQGILYLPVIAKPLPAYMREHRSEYRDAGLEALARPDLFESNVSPWWICSHGMNAVMDAIQNQEIKEPAWLKPKSEWTQIRADLVAGMKQYLEEQSRPQDDPIPIATEKYRTYELHTDRDYDKYAWTDSKRLLVAVPAGRKYVNRQKRLFFWGAQDRLEPLAHVNETFAFCAGQGNIFYVLEAERITKSGPHRYTYMIGPAGREKKKVVTVQAPVVFAKLLQSGTRSFSRVDKNTSLKQSSYDCRLVASEKISEKHDMSAWSPLLPGDGFLGFERKPHLKVGEKSTVSYYQNENADPTPLPIRWPGIDPVCVQYYQFKGAYFISVCVPNRDEGKKLRSRECIPAWWFWPKTGETEELCLKSDAISKNYVRYAPSRIGMLRFVAYRQTVHGKKPGGVYLNPTDGEPEKILEGVVKDASVSPDGCKVAVRTTEPRRDGVKPSFRDALRVIDLCAN